MELNILEKWVSMAVDLLFPRRCPICDEIVTVRGQLICPGCRGKAEIVKEPKCKKCGKEISSFEKEYCYDCGRTKHDFEYGWALYHYNEAMRVSVSRFKYKNKREYGDWYVEELLKRYGRKLRSLHADALIPIPIHPSKKRSRGFNQAELLARGLSQGTGILLNRKGLIRSLKTLPQKNLGPRDRLRNLQKAFQVDKSQLKGVKRVILVDDIYTTGSTIEACSRVLKAAGVQEVYFICLCIGKGY